MHVNAMNEPHSGDHEARRVLACLGDPSRFRLARLLVEGGRCVGELAREVGLSQSCTTRHLQALQRAGLVERRREGKRVRFSLRAGAPGLDQLLEWALAPRVAASTAPGGPAGGASPTRSVDHKRGREPGPGGAVERPHGRPAPGRPQPDQAASAEPASEGSAEPSGESEPEGEAPRRGHSDDLEDFLL